MVLLQDINEGMASGGSVPLVCCLCRGELILENPYRRLGRVRTGKLRCKEGCGVYSIIYGVPVMLLPGQPFGGGFPTGSLASFLRQHGKQKMMEALEAGEVVEEVKIPDPPVNEKTVRKVKREMSKAGWQQVLKKAKTSSEDSDAVAIAKRLSQIESGVMVDIGCGGGFTTERVLQETKSSVCCVTVDIRFDDVKQAGKRAEVLGMSSRCLEICTDARQLPFTDESLIAAYTRNGFNHICGYIDSLKETYRTLKKSGSLVVAERKSSMWHGVLENLGLNYEERLEVLRRLGWFTHGQEFIENINRAGFEILSIDDASYFFVDAIKRTCFQQPE